MKTVFKNVWVVTVNETNDVIRNGVVVVEGEKITYVGDKMPEVTANDRVIDGRGKKKITVPAETAAEAAAEAIEETAE